MQYISFDFITCDKCNGSGKVYFWNTLSDEERTAFYLMHVYNLEDSFYFEDRTELYYSQVKCPKCVGRRKIAVLENFSLKRYDFL